jgi:hypothetical protein
MIARERLLTALAGGQPDRVPCALSFYHLDLESLVPRDQSVDGLVDVLFVQFPLPEEEECVGPNPTKVTPAGHPVQVATYTRWQYRPQSTPHGNPGLRRIVGRSARLSLPTRHLSIAPKGWRARSSAARSTGHGRRRHAPPGRRAL